MGEYISRENVLDNSNIITVQTKEYGSIEVIPVDTIADIELADVQPVVHCKDCKYRKERHYEENGEKVYIKYECKFTKYSMSDDGFCSFGVRIDGNTGGKVNELDMEVNRPDGNCLDCKFQYLDNSDYWCSICPGNPEDI